MALTEKTLLPIFTDINPNTKTVSVAIDTIIEKDGVEISKQRHRRAFVPGDIDNVRTYIGKQKTPEIDYLNAIWTKDVIDDYKARLAREDVDQTQEN